MFSSLPRRWRVAPRAPADHIAFLAKIPAIIVQLLYNRGMQTPEAVEIFLEPRPELGNPFKIKDMEKAVTRLRQAIRSDEPIAIYGDFDADGVTATAVLSDALNALGARVMPYIPHRVDEGYGLNKDALKKLANEGIKLIVTVDCGIRSVAEVAYGNNLGLDIIITDHHSVGEELPPALVVIDPKRPDESYSFRELAGVGIAYKLAQALLLVNQHAPINGACAMNAEDLLDLVALGTVADVVPLVDENRVLVQQGLVQLNQIVPNGFVVSNGSGGRIGLRKMFATAGVQHGQVDAFTIGFVLGPRINAAGRIDDAMLSYHLLTSRSEDEAARLAQELEAKNRERQQLTVDIVENARQQVLSMQDAPLLFVEGADYQAGIVGLAASRLTEEYYRPSIVLERGEETSRASCRSIPEFHITAALDQCANILISHGGHAAAAGFTVATRDLPELKARLMAIAEEQLRDKELVPTLDIDAEIDMELLSWDLHDWLQRLHPFGEGNPAPLFLTRRVQVLRYRAVGNEGRHLKISLRDNKGFVWDAIAFRQGEWAAKMPTYIDLVYSLEVNEWRGERKLQLNVQDLRPAE